MKYPRAYVEYLIHFHGDRDYFECHEILEEYWKAQSVREDQWVMLIQLAVGLYHHRRGNFAGAAKMLKSVEAKLTPHFAESLSIDYTQLNQNIKERLVMIENGDPYEEINLPIMDPKLLDSCQQECINRGWEWQALSSNDEQLIHRHTLRNRSQVILEREESRRKKQEK